jgi:dolichol kinase
MRRELPRQLIHLSGFLFVVVAQTVGKTLVSFYLFTIAATFLIYSVYLTGEQKRLIKQIEKMENQLRDFVFHFEREGIVRPFTGAIWFFFSAGLSFLLFPLDIASAAVIMLAVGDGISTIVGKKFGKHRLIGKKTLEGSTAMLFSSFIAVLFLPFSAVLLGSVVAALSELLPEVGGLRNLREKGWVDDNFFIPVLAGVAMYVVLYL